MYVLPPRDGSRVESACDVGLTTVNQSSLRPATLLKRLLKTSDLLKTSETLAQMSSCELREISKNTFSYRTHLVF